MTQLNNFEEWFLSLGTGMTQLNKFRDRDDTDEQVWGPKQSICEFRDRYDTTSQV